MAVLPIRTESVTNAAYISHNHWQSKQVFDLSNGNQLMLVRDKDVTTTLYVYEITTDRTIQILRQTLTVPAAFREVVGALFPNNDLAVMTMDATGKAFRYAKVIYGTWSAVVWEAPFNAYASDIARTFDISVSDTGAVAMVHHWVGTFDMSSSIYIRRPAGGAWIQANNELHILGLSSASRWVAGADSCAIQWLHEQSSGVRHLVVADGRGAVNGDLGIKLKRMQITEATGLTVGGTVQDLDTIGTGTGTTSLAVSLNGRLVNLYRLANNKFIVMALHSANNNNVPRCVARVYTTNLSTTFTLGNTFGSTIPGSPVRLATTVYYPSVQDAQNGYGSFVFAWTEGNATSNRKVGSNILRLEADGSGSWSTGNTHSIQIQPYITGLHSLGSRNLDTSKAELLVESYAQGVSTKTIYTELAWGKIPPSSVGAIPITNILPSNGSTVPTSTPALTARFDIPSTRSQSKYRVHWQLAQNAGFTTGLIDFYGTYSVIRGVVTVIENSPNLVGNPWYLRARVEDEFGNTGAWTTTNSFIQGHPPVAVGPFSPIDYVLYGSGSIYLDWNFSDPSPTDSQTAYQVRIWTADGVTLLHDTGKVLSTETRYLHTFTAPDKEVGMMWEVKLWDTEDNSLNWSTPNYFVLSDPPNVTVTYPVAGSTIGTGVPTIAATIDVFAPRTLVKEYTVSVWQGGVLIWSQRRVGSFTDPGSGYVVNEKVPSGLLRDTESYSVQIAAIDFAGLAGVSDIVPFTVDWIPPDPASGVAIDDSPYNVVNEGHILVTWDDLNREVDNFVAWKVYRRSDMRNPYTGEILEIGTPEVIFIEYALGDTYEHKDYYAPSGYMTTYWVTQLVDRDGQEIESDLVGPVETVPNSDGYWLITPSVDEGDADAFKISLVKGDSFTDEEEEAEIVVIGVGRTYQKGEKLGAKGSLECQLRNTDGTTARQKRLRLQAAQEQDTVLFLRNPFGDVFKVNVSQVSLSRIAGVGTAEFCDVTIPYAKVGR